MLNFIDKQNKTHELENYLSGKDCICLWENYQNVCAKKTQSRQFSKWEATKWR